MRHVPLSVLCTIWIVTVPMPGPATAADHPLPREKREKLRQEFDEAIGRLTDAIAADPDDVRLYSQRGDARFFRGEFKAAAADYQKMVELDPKLKTSHWRRGIAWFYAGEYKQAAHQFEIYDTFDDVDRENGIWRFFSQTKAYGLEKARQGLLKYKKDDREPFPSVYKLFSGEITPQEILDRIRKADLTDDEREKRLFYAELYIGLNYDVRGEPEKAVEHLRNAVANTWGPKGGYGPRYMWHVGRLHYNLLVEDRKPKN